ncbi:hypothetical protein EDB85DRAFT_1961506 [Lactarius pseudohatsudake]|nr:hypothetical protein EDB85DRAFT_1961506 [Lactarius pseudohatsudake]
MFCSRSIRAMCSVWLWIVGGAPISPVVSCHFSTSLGQRGRRAVGMKENPSHFSLILHLLATPFGKYTPKGFP